MYSGLVSLALPRLRAAALATLAGAIFFSSPTRAQGSDNCATPQAIFGSGPFVVNNTAATTAPPPAATLCAPIPKNVWFRWQAPATGGIAVLSSCGMTTVPLEVTVYQYQGAGCPASPGTTASYCFGACFVSWAVVPNFFYVIEMGGPTGGSGTFTITVPPPSTGTSYCDPGAGGVIPCPCGNPPSGAGRGCDNSSATGGAQLSATGSASLSVDTVVITTSGEKPTASSILLQGTASLASGALFGQGVRCASGTLLRLYVHIAVGGMATFPSGADPTISARSAQLGFPIPANSDRYYAVYYRDPIVLGGCAPGNTFNSTQSYQITWQP
jgi:hypothetical protein